MITSPHDTLICRKCQALTNALGDGMCRQCLDAEHTCNSLRDEILRLRNSLHNGTQYYAEGIKAALDSILERYRQ